MIKDQIQSRIISSMKAKDKETTNTLKQIKALIVEQEKQGNEVTDELAQKLISKYVKQREESLKAANDANREDLAEKEKNEIKVLEQYLPQLLSEEETRKIVEDLVKSGKNNIGMIMGSIKSYGNTIDKKLVSQIARELI